MKHCRRGFTLVEILVATTILLMVVSASLGVFLSVNRSMAGLSDAIDLNADTRITQERILLDLRALTKVTQADTQAITGEFIEYATGRTGVITYSFSQGRLERRTTIAGSTAQTVVMADLQTTGAAGSVSSFRYINRSGTTTTTAAEVRSVQLKVVPQASARQAAKLVPGRNTAFCSALVLLRNIAG